MANYGRYSWCVELLDGGEIMLQADRMLSEGGAVLFWQDYQYDDDFERSEREDGPCLLLVIPLAQVNAAYSASALDSSPVAVHWWRNADGEMHVESRQ